jgi:hypothetical protein
MTRPPLAPALVLSVAEQQCTVQTARAAEVVGFAAPFPAPRTERVSPGHLVAVAAVPDGPQLVVWRWYDAVVVGRQGDLVRLWEPAHGEVLAQPRHPDQPFAPGGRAYLSAGLPGAEWWVAGPAVVRPQDAEVELDEVDALFTAHGLWDRLV